MPRDIRDMKPQMFAIGKINEVPITAYLFEGLIRDGYLKPRI
jgi:hypothetical protein